MEENQIKNLSYELNSFKGTLLANLIGGTITLAFAVSTTVTLVFSLIGSNFTVTPEVIINGVKILGLGLGLRWIISSVEVFSEFESIFDDYQVIRDDMTPEQATKLIIHNLAFYRENKEVLQRLKLGSKITGSFLLLMAALQVYNIVTNPAIPGSTFWAIMSIIGLICMLGVGLLGLLSPIYFEKYSATWDERLEKIEATEKKLEEILEEE